MIAILHVFKLQLFLDLISSQSEPTKVFNQAKIMRMSY